MQKVPQYAFYFVKKKNNLRSKMGTALICFYILTNQDSNIFGCIWS